MTDLIPWTAEDFADSFQRHMPTGPVWPRDPGTTQRAVVKALMPTYARSWAVACDLPAETLPSTTTYLLDEWEASLGLPDPCPGPDPTIAQRQAHVVARLTQSDGPSIPSLTAFAAALGYAIKIVEHAPRRFGSSRFGDPFGGPAWAFAWTAIAPQLQVVPRMFGVSRFGEPYATWEQRALECELRRLAPAHTVLLFAYSAALGSFVLGQNSPA